MKMELYVCCYALLAAASNDTMIMKDDSYCRSQQDALFLNFTLIYNCTCFGPT
jgi:hypothetical protein